MLLCHRLQCVLATLAILAAPLAAAESHHASPAPYSAKASYQDTLLLQGDVEVTSIRLDALEHSFIDKVRELNSASRLKRLHIGIGREIPQDAPASSSALTWQATSGGVAARWKVTSAGAKALRVALDMARMPTGVELRFAGLDRIDTVYGPFTWKEVARGNRTYWSPTLEGESAIVELFVPSHLATSAVRLSIVQVSHLFVSPADPNATKLAKAAGTCEVDFICRAASDPALAQTGKSVARMTFSSEGDTFLCTGTLLNPSDNSFTPYFWSAAHCITTPAEASTLTTHWNYEKTGCNTGTTSPSYVQVAGGAALLFVDQEADAAFLRLNASPPASAVFAGWDAATLSLGTPVTAIHHPDGDLKKVSLGTVGSFGPVPGSLGNFLRVEWNSLATGVTEAGSSGGGIFSGNAGTGYRFRGGLLGGDSSCTASPTELNDEYSRFDLAYPFVAQFLNPASAPAFGSNVVASPGFESGATGWVQSSSSGRAIITTEPGTARTGSAVAFLGGGINLTETLYQDVAIPPGLARLQFYYRITTQETLPFPYDTVTVAILNRTTGAVLRTLTTLSNQMATSGWVQSPVLDVSPFAGQTVRLRFRASLDESLSTSFFIDDVAITAAAAATANNYTALWWNAAESGWGINVNQQGDVAFATLFTYDATGAPMWLVMSGGTRQGNSDTFTGDLYRTTGPVFNASPFTPIGAGNVTRVGSMTLTFGGPNSGTLTYSVNGTAVTKAIERQVYGTAAAYCQPMTRARAAATNFQDLWWNPAESGWGLNITQQGNVLFATLFTYGSGNQGLWLVMSAGTRQIDGSYLGDLYRTNGPAFNAQPWGAVSVTRVGNMRLQFTSGESATLTYSVDGTAVTKTIVRQVFSSPMPLCTG